MEQNQEQVKEQTKPTESFDYEKYLKKQKKNNTIAQRSRDSRIFIIALLIVPVINMIVMWTFVRFRSVAYAFQDQFGHFTTQNFVDFWELLTKKKTLLYVLGNTFKVFLPTEFIGVPLSLVLSYFIYKQIPGYKFFRFVYYLPRIIMGMVMVTAFSQFVGRGGTFEMICRWFGVELPELGLLRTPETALWTVIVFGILTSACSNILFYSAMGRVPPEVIESGKLEGLSMFQELIYLIIPLIWPTLSMTLILDFGGMLNASGDILLFGIEDLGVKETYTLNYWFFKQVYGGYGTINNLGNFGLMSAIGWVITLVNAPIVLFVRWLADKIEVDY